MISIDAKTICKTFCIRIVEHSNDSNISYTEYLDIPSIL